MVFKLVYFHFVSFAFPPVFPFTILGDYIFFLNIFIGV